MKILRRLVRLPGFLLWFAGQMFAANWQVARDVLTPGSALTPGVVAYFARSRTSMEVMGLADLITLTPGTMVLDVSTDDDGGHTLYVLGVYAPPTPAEFRAELHDLEARMLHVARGEPSSEVRSFDDAG